VLVDATKHDNEWRTFTLIFRELLGSAGGRRRVG
jgi:hypothetical protein